MKEYKFEKNTWVIVKGDKPHGIFLEPGHSITTINEVEIFEDENLWKSKKSKLGIVDITEPVFNEKVTEPKNKKIKDKSDTGPRVAR